MPKRSAAFALFLLLAVTARADDAKRAFTLDDLYRVKTVGEPAISPDGRTIAYSVTTNDWSAKKTTVALWRMDADGVPSRLIVFEKAGHWPSAFEMGLYYAAHLDWFHRFLGGEASPWKPEDLVSGR